MTKEVKIKKTDEQCGTEMNEEMHDYDETSSEQIAKDSEGILYNELEDEESFKEGTASLGIFFPDGCGSNADENFMPALCS